MSFATKNQLQGPIAKWSFSTSGRPLIDGPSLTYCVMEVILHMTLWYYFIIVKHIRASSCWNLPTPFILTSNMKCMIIQYVPFLFDGFMGPCCYYKVFILLFLFFFNLIKKPNLNVLVFTYLGNWKCVYATLHHLCQYVAYKACLKNQRIEEPWFSMPILTLQYIQDIYLCVFLYVLSCNTSMYQ